MRLNLGMDFAIQSVDMLPDAVWRGRLQRGEVTKAQFMEAERSQNNVVEQITIVLKAIEPAGKA